MTLLAGALALGLCGVSQAAMFVVTNSDDSGPGSLRAAIIDANATPEADVISFASGGTISLLSALPDITADLTIGGQGRDNTVIDGVGSHQIFRANIPTQPVPVMAQAAGDKGVIAAPLRIRIEGMTLQNGYSPYSGGCIQVANTRLEIIESALTGCDGGGGSGGAIDMAPAPFPAPPDAPGTSTLLIEDSEFVGNIANQAGGAIAAIVAVSDSDAVYGLRILNSEFRENQTNTSGGAIAALPVGASDILLDNAGLSGNRAYYSAGGMWITKDPNSESAVSILGSRFINNRLEFGKHFIEGGVGLAMTVHGPTVIRDSVFTGNQLVDPEAPAEPQNSRAKGLLSADAVGGGAMLQITQVGNQRVVVERTDFADNLAAVGGGLAVIPVPSVKSRPADRWADRARLAAAPKHRVPASGKGVGEPMGVSLIDASFIGNTSLLGSAVMAAGDMAEPTAKGVSSGTVVLERVTATGNVSLLAELGVPTGGGTIVSAGSANLSMHVINSTVTDNIGGGVLLGGGGPSDALRIDNSTITDNAGMGAGVLPFITELPELQATADRLGLRARNKAYGPQTYPVAVRNSIVSGHVVDFEGTPTAVDILPSADVTLLHSLLSQAEAELPGVNNAGGNVFGADPQLDALADNGGLTQTRLPLSESPVIDAGDLAFATPPDTDQRGAPRVVGAVVDIGAVEVAGIGPAQPGFLQFDPASISVDEDAGSVTLTVTRTDGSDGAVSVAYATANGTAVAGSDYTSASGTLTWANGDSAAKTFSVTLLDDATDEADETFTAVLSGATGKATITGDTATVIILDNDAPAPVGEVGFVGADPDGVLRLRINEDGSAASAAKGLLTLSVELAPGSVGPASVQYATVDGTATSPSDFTAASGVLTWGAGESGARTIALNIVEDALPEPDETFSVVLSNSVGAGIGDGVAQIVIVQHGTVTPPVVPAPAMIPAGDWRSMFAMFGVLLAAGWVALRRRG